MEDGSLEHSLIATANTDSQSEVTANAMHVWVPEREDRLPDARLYFVYLLCTQYSAIRLDRIGIDIA